MLLRGVIIVISIWRTFLFTVKASVLTCQKTVTFVESIMEASASRRAVIVLSLNFLWLALICVVVPFVKVIFVTVVQICPSALIIPSKPILAIPTFVLCHSIKYNNTLWLIVPSSTFAGFHVYRATVCLCGVKPVQWNELVQIQSMWAQVSCFHHSVCWCEFVWMKDWKAW